MWLLGPAGGIQSGAIKRCPDDRQGAIVSPPCAKAARLGITVARLFTS